ncbi:glutamine--fructose-6-phosphate transaminase (isomerizing) [Candidatus Aminicenantes bacterium AC-335-K20]|jgi:glucosamine--fructose-6-phosphate aminotransferase (isomerizing)|nr:glutamine--fructose-6-phosphate transaminase (isomerizing) [SCandidatus Aminicenantes bacterium Aminicenantia_JdfR_composite]MCP2596561.1 glutamine--fructose-6-phosphate transaminase (isomerizing) [Candidatus Aminicenantes bacterium AC-335-G13]MCP2598327.1 glutamine--fructose-6-phosphate transaminase (isomerizing) [Candidatus Aminicenantes bacterium AC-335-L06]MCP2605433.1 glutamine--fructose-6-phosphate transaminase (isomerizing) [Candidatus Aminicenantes bacterium AC-335-O07]MCP2606120.1 g
MCGIIGYIGPRNTIKVLIEGLKRLEYRGYDSAGIAVMHKGEIKRVRVKGKICDLENLINEQLILGDYGIGHTRWATHGEPSENNAHPHIDCKGEIIVVHNGIIENYSFLKNTLIKDGHIFVSETDTEVIPHLIEHYYEGNLLDAVKKTVKLLKGDFTFIAISKNELDQFIGVKNGPPLILGINDKEKIISSDLAPILNFTKDVYHLENGEICYFSPDKIEFYDFEGNRIKKEKTVVNWSPHMIEKRGFKHFMLKEIFEQPHALRETIIGKTSLDEGKIDFDVEPSFFKNIENVHFIACGTSFHAGLVGKYFFEEICEVPSEVDYASEFRYRNFLVEKNSLFVFISQSGETADTLASLREVKRKGGRTLGIINVPESAIARESDATLYTQAGPEIGVASTKAFTTQLGILFLLALFLAKQRGRIKTSKLKKYISELHIIPHKMEKFLNKSKDIEELANRYYTYQNFLYLGRWVNYPISLEGALKLKEISYIHAEGYPAGEMKHGPIALIDEQTPTVAIAMRDRVYSKILNNISEVWTRGGKVIAVIDEDNNEIVKEVTNVIRIPKTEEILTPFLTTIPLQLFAYYIALRRGTDVDQPRNLAKSVTVE